MARLSPAITAVISALLLVAIGTCAANQVTLYDFYHLNVTVSNPAQATFAPGSAMAFTVSINNSEPYIFDGYIVATQAYGCDVPSPYNFNISDCDTIVSSTVTKAKVASGETKAFSLSEVIPAGARPGTWRVDVYVMMNNTSVDGNYVAYDPRHYFAYNVTGSGKYPKVSILKSQTHVAGGYAQSGPSVPETGPIRGYVGLKNLDNADFSGTLEISYCAFDDYMGSCRVSQTKDVSIPTGKTTGVMYSILDRLERGIYSIRYRVLETGKEVSEYKNRLIIDGKTINIISIDAYKESYEKGQLVQLRTAFTGPYFPAQDEVNNPVATTIVYNNTGHAIYAQADNYSVAKPDDILVQQYAFKAPSALEGYTACIEVIGEGASKKSCASFGKATGLTEVQAPAATVEPSSQPTQQAATPTATVPAANTQGKDDNLAIAAIILAACALVAYGLFRNQKPPVAAAILLLLAMVPLAHAVDCPAFQFNFDANNNGVNDGGDPSLTVRSSGSVYYLPINTIVTAPGQCNYTYYTTAYTVTTGYNTYCSHVCRNTASRCYTTSYIINTSNTQANIGYYTHYVTVSVNPITYTEVVTHSVNTSALTKQSIVDVIKKHTFTDLSFSVNANQSSIYPGLAASGLPAYPFGEVESNTNSVDNYIMGTVLTNYCSSAINNCTYRNETSAYGVYAYTGYQYFVNFSIHNYTMHDLPVNYTHQNGTEMRILTDYVIDSYDVNGYPVTDSISGPYTLNYTLHNFAYVYRINDTHAYSYALPEYYIPAYTITGYTVDARPNTNEYFVKWESAVIELYDRGFLVGILTPSTTRTLSTGTVLATNARSYRILDTGIYYLSHTYS